MGKQKATRRERFLGEMQAAVPWARLVASIESFYPGRQAQVSALGSEPDAARVLSAIIGGALADKALEDAIHE